MAERALKKLEEQLNCSICLDTYTDPKELQCHHVFCQKCLVKMVVRDQQGQLTLTCPTCRQVTPVPASGVRGLQSAFHINHFLEIRDSVKQIQSIRPSLEGDSVIGSRPIRKLSYCSVHSEREVELYCETCEKLICLKCAIAGSKHHNHAYKELEEVFEKYKGEISSSLEPLEKQLNTIKIALTELDARCGEISSQRESIQSDIYTTVEGYHRFLDVRKTELIDQLNCISKAKLKDLAVQKDQLETVQAQLSSCLEYIQESLQAGDHGEVLKMKTTIATQVKELSTAFHPAMLEPNTDADAIVLFSEDFSTACQSYGQVVALKYQAIGKGLETGTVKQTSRVWLKVVDTKNHPCNIPNQSVRCELVSVLTGVRVQGSVERRGQSHYEISYEPTVKGRHQLHITISSQHIKGSPFEISVKHPNKVLGTPIATIGGVVEPWGVALNHRGELVVAESGAHCISVFSLGGERLYSFGSFGCGQGELDQPRGIALDKDGNIVVADNGNHRIQKFSALGQFLAAVGCEGNGQLQFKNPQDVAFNTSNNKLYVVDLNHRVQILNSDLTHHGSFGEHGHNKKQFLFPWSIACDNTGKVYVADTHNHRIQVFTAEGRFLRLFGGRGEGRGGLECSSGIAVDTSGLVYVSDRRNHSIAVFTSEGQFMMRFSDEGVGGGEGHGEFKAIGIEVEDSGVVYVCDKTGHIKFF